MYFLCGGKYPFYSGCHHRMCCMGSDFLSNWFISGVIELNIAELDAPTYALLGCFQRQAFKAKENKDGLLNWLVLLRYFPALLLRFLFGYWRGKHREPILPFVFPMKFGLHLPWKVSPFASWASSLNTILVQGPLYLSADNFVIFCSKSPLYVDYPEALGDLLSGTEPDWLWHLDFSFLYHVCCDCNIVWLNQEVLLPQVISDISKSQLNCYHL